MTFSKKKIIPQVWSTLCLCSWDPAETRGNNFEKTNKVGPLIFMKFWSNTWISLIGWPLRTSSMYYCVLMYCTGRNRFFTVQPTLYIPWWMVREKWAVHSQWGEILFEVHFKFSKFIFWNEGKEADCTYIFKEGM